MSQSNLSEVPVRIVKKRKGGHGHHGGAWKVAYADFVTAMMALFIVLWIVGQSKQIKQYVAAYFQDPRGASTTLKHNHGGEGLMDSGGGGKSLLEPRPQAKQQLASLSILGQKIREELQRRSVTRRLLKQVQIEVVKEGLRIELIDESQSFFFDLGTSSIKPEAAEVLRTIAQELGQIPNHLVIEGHTDSRPYASSNTYSNFELSADRANRARQILITNGVENEQIDEVRGCADRRLRDPAHPFAPNNRRVSILVKLAPEQSAEMDRNLEEKGK